MESSTSPPPSRGLSLFRERLFLSLKQVSQRGLPLFLGQIFFSKANFSENAAFSFSRASSRLVMLMDCSFDGTSFSSLFSGEEVGAEFAPVISKRFPSGSVSMKK